MRGLISLHTHPVHVNRTSLLAIVMRPTGSCKHSPSRQFGTTRKFLAPQQFLSESEDQLTRAGRGRRTLLDPEEKLAAANSGFKPCTTVDLTINYMRPITKADALLEAKVMRLGRTLAFCTCEVREVGGEKPAAFSTGTYAILG